MSQASTDIDTSVLSDMEFDSICEIKLRQQYPPFRIVELCNGVAFAVATIHTIQRCETTTINICKPCLERWKDHNCFVCNAGFLINWMVI